MGQLTAIPVGCLLQLRHELHELRRGTDAIQQPGPFVHRVRSKTCDRRFAKPLNSLGALAVDRIDRRGRECVVMIARIFYGMTADERWNRRFRSCGITAQSAEHRSSRGALKYARPGVQAALRDHAL